jgi:hypothetical protein
MRIYNTTDISIININAEQKINVLAILIEFLCNNDGNIVKKDESRASGQFPPEALLSD